MSKRSRPLLFVSLIVATLAALIYLSRPPRSAADRQPRPPGPIASSSSAETDHLSPEAPPDQPSLSDQRAHPSVAAAPGSQARQAQSISGTATLPEVAGNHVSPSQPSPAADLAEVRFMFRDYRAVMGQNPVGTNAEIMAAILGKNPRQLKLDLPVGSSLNAGGELVDRWGTPYFFHQLSGTEMEIRSAGPDRQMWTDDDQVTR